MKEIDFLPENFRYAAHRRKLRRRLAILAGLVVAYIAAHLTYETRMDRVLASASDWSRGVIETGAATLPGGGGGGIKSHESLNLDSRIAQAERAVLRLLGNEYRLCCLSFETGAIVGTQATNLHGRLRAVAKNELAVGVFMGRLEACPHCNDMELSFLREVREDGKPMREFELTFTLNLHGFSE